MQEHTLLHTRQYQVSHKHSCISWWWAHNCPKHVEIYKYTESKLCTKLVLFTKLYRDAQSTKHKICYSHLYVGTEPILHLIKRSTWCICEERWPSWRNALFCHHCCFNSVWYAQSLWNIRNIPSQLNTIFSVDTIADYYAIMTLHLDFFCYIIKNVTSWKLLRFRQNVCVQKNSLLCMSVQ